MDKAKQLDNLMDLLEPTALWLFAAAMFGLFVLICLLFVHILQISTAGIMGALIVFSVVAWLAVVVD